MSDSIFKAPATVDLEGVQSVSELASREGFTSPAEYAAQFAQALCNSGSLDSLRERFLALTGAAGYLDPDNAAASEIGLHYIVLQALFHKLIIQSVAVTQAGGRGSSEAGERLLNGALKAQRAALACLSALRVLRDAAPTTSVPRVHESGMAGAGLPPSLSALSGSN